MRLEYPGDYPKNREEAVIAALSIRDEDIDLSDMPETDFSQAERVGDRFWKMGERNLARRQARAKPVECPRSVRQFTV